MARIKHLAAQIIGELRETEVLLGQGMKVPEVIRQLGVTEQTYCLWRKEYGGLKTDHANKLKELERESTRFKKLLAEAQLDMAMPQEIASGNL